MQMFFPWIGSSNPFSKPSFPRCLIIGTRELAACCDFEGASMSKMEKAAMVLDSPPQ
jgi:hypothetical protein